MKLLFSLYIAEEYFDINFIKTLFYKNLMLLILN